MRSHLPQHAISLGSCCNAQSNSPFLLSCRLLVKQSQRWRKEEELSSDRRKNPMRAHPIQEKFKDLPILASTSLWCHSRVHQTNML
ncbi:hypothetical protein EV2_042136 [Malus domestica]